MVAAPPASAGSAQPADGALGDRDAAMLGHHGVVTVGRTKRDAHGLARTVEHLPLIDGAPPVDPDFRGARVDRA